MKRKKLDARGFSHDILIVLFVVIFAIAGVAYLVASHADSCDSSASGVSSATSDTTSDATCPVSDSTSGAVSSSPESQVTCAITGIPSSPSYNTTLSPQLQLTNNGSSRVVVVTNTVFSLYKPDGTSVYQQTPYPSTNRTVDQGATYTAPLGAYTVPYSSASIGSGGYEVSISGGGSCSTRFTLPSAPVATTPQPLANIIIEGENMTGSKDTTNQASSTASNKLDRPMWHSGTLTKSFTSTGKLTGVTVRAQANVCSGSPQMVVVVDGKAVIQTPVGSTTWANFTGTLTSNTSTSHSVIVAFTNDYATKTCDRNLYIDNLTFTQQK